MASKLTPSPRPRFAAAVLAALALASGAAGCGGSGGGAKGHRAEGRESAEGTPGAVLAPEPGEEGAALNHSQAEAASIKREAAELAALKHRREVAERAAAANAGAPKTHKQTHKSKSGTSKHKKTEKKKSAPKTSGGGKKSHETSAEQEARKHFEAEEAREAAEFKRQASKE